MGRLIILPLRVEVVIEGEDGEPIKLPELRIPEGPRPPDQSRPPIVALPPPGIEPNILDVSGQLPRDPANNPTPLTALKSSITFHWLGGAFDMNASDEAALDALDSFARQHIAKDWGGGFGGNGIMYHEAIAPSGTVFILRDYTEVVWHAGAYEPNLHSRAILIMAGPGSEATEAQLAMLRRRYFDFNVRAYGHQEWSATQCPGVRIMEALEAVR